MIQVCLVTGNTYPYRREIKSLGGKWNPDNKGWVVPATKSNEVAKIVYDYKLVLEIIETDPINLETPTGERLRAIRQAKLDKLADRLDAQSQRLYKEADQKQAEFNSHHGDISYFTQPNINSSGGRAFSRSRQRVLDRAAAGAKLGYEAQQLAEKADYLKHQTARIKGDADRKRQAERDAKDQLIKVGDRVLYPLFAKPECTVIKVNKKTYTVQFDYDKGTDRTLALEKSFFQVLKAD